MKKIIVIDPGHFASTPGKCSPDGKFREYKWTFMMAEKLCNMLRQKGYNAILDITKEQSESTTQHDYLTKRAAFANNLVKQVNSLQDICFVSIHNNASPPCDGKWHSARGWSIFVAANKQGKITGSKNSQRLADSIFKAIKAQGIQTRQPSPTQCFWPGNFTVLTATQMPAVLIENMFMDNAQDVILLNSEDFQYKLLEGWCKGIQEYMGDSCNCGCPCCN